MASAGFNELRHHHLDTMSRFDGLSVCCLAGARAQSGVRDPQFHHVRVAAHAYRRSSTNSDPQYQTDSRKSLIARRAVLGNSIVIVLDSGSSTDPRRRTDNSRSAFRPANLRAQIGAETVFPESSRGEILQARRGKQRPFLPCPG